MGDMGGSSSSSKREHVADLLGHLSLQEGEQESFVWGEEIVEPPAVV